MFKFQLNRTVAIDGCPESGLAAIDFRRANGLPDDTDNQVDINIDVVDENLVRKCAEAGVPVDGNGNIDFRRNHTHGTWWVRRGVWSRPGFENNSEYLLPVPAELIVRVMSDEASDARDVAIVEMMRLHVEACRQAVSDWQAAEAAHLLKRAAEAAAKSERAAKIAAARELLQEELAECQKWKTRVDVLSNFLSHVPLDALQGTLKSMTANAQGESIDSLRTSVEDASVNWVFSNRDDDDDDE